MNKNRHDYLSREDKDKIMKLVAQVESGELDIRKKDIAARFHIAPATLSCIIKKERRRADN
jgi:transcriptional regulator CtsR